MEEFAIAHRLGRTVAEIQEMPVSEYDGWRQYFNLTERKRG